MNFSWQDIAAVIIVVAVAIYLFLRLFRIGPWKRKSLCEICEPGKVEQPEQNLIGIKTPEQYLPEQCHPEHSNGSQ